MNTTTASVSRGGPVDATFRRGDGPEYIIPLNRVPFHFTGLTYLRCANAMVSAYIDEMRECTAAAFPEGVVLARFQILHSRWRDAIEPIAVIGCA